ncbi:MAG: CPBP family intramembrane metalloprotease [Acidobacteriota bacterium]|nr:CPBP family intramembrane metalloprotease [Acidobacteriota bacterium]
MEISSQTIPENLPTAQPKNVLPNEIPTPNNPPWNWITAFLVWLASILFLVVPSIFVFIYAQKQGVDIRNADLLKEFLLTDTLAILIQIVLVIPAHALTLVLAWLVITKGNKYSFFEMVGWKWNGFKFWHAPLLLTVFFSLAYLLTYIFGEQPNDFTKMLESSKTVVYLVVFLAIFSAPIVEEVIYRGVLYSAFQRRFGIRFGIFITTILFAGVHVFQYYPSVAPIILIFLLSLTLTLIRAKTSSLLPCIAFHMIFNAISSIQIILQTFLPQNSGDLQEKVALTFHLFK